ncbi:MAG: hypothetical protein FJ388_23350, partial [Verrucomicrobia bacterium]|nr:hypothetical protein [Verrucomicrobiota bacterium]
MVLIEHVRIVWPGQKIESGSLLLDETRIQAIHPARETVPADAQRVDGGGRLLTPGLIDIHTHGVRTHQYQASPDEIIGGSQVLPEYGTTCFLPTLAPQKGPNLLGELGALASALER